MKRILFTAALWIAFFLLPAAQEKPAVWTLQSCLEYARMHNIQIRKSQIALEESAEETELARAQFFPSLSASVTQGVVSYPSPDAGRPHSSYSGNYSLDAGWTLFEGGKRLQAVRESTLQEQVQELGIERSGDDIDKAIIRCYMQLLYAIESVGINENTVSVSQAQVERSRELLAAGSISPADLAQLESQYSTDRYQLVAAQAALDDYRLQLKQLLELEITDTVEVAVPGLTAAEILIPLPAKEQVYETALQQMPEVRMSRLGIDIADLQRKQALAGYWPTLSLNAGVGTGHVSGSDYVFGSQLWNSFNASVGLTLRVPIYTNRSNKTAVRKSKLALQTSRLELADTEKSLLKEVEGVYLDAASAQHQYMAAADQVRAAGESYRLVEEQFFLGMKNTVELLVEKSNYLTAQQQLLQAKYTTALNLRLLDLYQRKSLFPEG